MTPKELADRLEDDELVSLDLLKQAAKALRESYTGFDVTVAYDCGIRAGQEDERKAIVTWLREQDGHGYDDMRANCIEAGEHRK